MTPRDVAFLGIHLGGDIPFEHLLDAFGLVQKGAKKKDTSYVEHLRRRNWVVYCLTEEGDGRFAKIGTTSMPVETRIKQLQTGNPRRLVALWTILGGHPRERQIQNSFRHLKVLRGGDEWYEVSEELVALGKKP